MNIGILYDANNYYRSNIEKDFHMLSGITKLSNALAELKHSVILIDGISELNELIYSKEKQLDLIFNYIAWTRSSQKISATSFFNYYNIPFIGNSEKALILCADKLISKLIAQNIDIKVPKYIYDQVPEKELTSFLDIKQSLGCPFVIKANGSSGSLGVRKIQTQQELDLVRKDFKKKWNTVFLYEEYIDGHDIMVPVISKNNISHALGVVKYLDSHEENINFFSTEMKYFEEIKCVSFNNANTKIALKYAEQIHTALGCTIFSRSDFRINPNGEIYFLECNATPDFNPNGAFVVASNEKTLALILQEIIDEVITKT